MHRGKKYIEATKLIDHDKTYPPEEAISLAKQTAPAKFDETVELHMRTGLDPRHADQQIRGTALLPHGLGKQIRVLVFAEGEGARNAEQAGADFVGSRRPDQAHRGRLDRLRRRAGLPRAHDQG